MSPLTVEEADETTAVAAPSQARWVPQQYFDVRFKTAIVDQLEALRKLVPGWDGYRAAPINTTIIDAAQAFVHRLTDSLAPRPLVVPLPSGAVQLEWVR